MTRPKLTASARERSGLELPPRRYTNGDIARGLALVALILGVVGVSIGGVVLVVLATCGG